MLKILAAMCVLLSVGACKKKQSAVDYGLNPKETVRVAILTEPPSLDWNKSSDTSSSFITENIMEGLCGYDFEAPVIGLKPELASEWTSANNSKSWEFTLRDDVYWTDGVKLTPQHVVDGWERLLNPETASVYAYFLFGIKNAHEYSARKITDFSKVAVKIEGQKIKVELNEPIYFPYLLTHHSTYPIRKDIVEKYGDRWTEAENIVTLGAYKLKVWEHDKALVFERNETYYGEKTKNKNVIAYIIEEQSTALNLFKGGQVDALMTLPSSLLGVLRNRKDYSKNPALVTYYFGFNTKKPPLDNVHLRRAIAAAIDRKQVTDMLQGGQTPLSGWIPVGMFGYDEKAGISFDVSAALEHYKLAGYSKQNPAPSITLAYNTNEDHKRIAENIQAQLKKNLNLNVQINNEEWKVYLRTLRANTPHMYRMGWVADYPDPHNFYELMMSTSDNNHTGWRDPSFDKLLKQAAETNDPKKKEEFYAQAGHKLLYDATAVFPLHSGVNQQLVSQRIKNFPQNVMSRYPLKNVEVVK